MTWKISIFGISPNLINNEINKNGIKEKNNHLMFRKYRIVKQILVITISVTKYQS
jgi:hypothetical protein